MSKMDFLVDTGTPYDVIVGIPSLEELQICIDLGQQHVQVSLGAETIRLSLEVDEDCKKPGSGTDSKDFTSDPGPCRLTRLIRMKILYCHRVNGCRLNQTSPGQEQPIWTKIPMLGFRT